MPYHKNVNYFDAIDTEEKAYFLGLLFADGSNDLKAVTIGLHERDTAILQRLSVALFGCIRLRRRKPYCRVYKGITINASAHTLLSVSSVRLCARLAEIGMIPKKALTHAFPSAVPDHLLRHFVRGYFDGDGCLSHRTHNHAKRYLVTILSSSPFCSRLTEIVAETLSIPMRPVKTGCKIAGVGLSGNRQIKAFMDWLYHDATVYLERKHSIYRELCADIHRMDTKPRSSRYRNVTFDKTRNRWAANVRVDKRTLRLGRFLTEQAAYEAQQAYLSKNGVQVGCLAS